MSELWETNEDELEELYLDGTPIMSTRRDLGTEGRAPETRSEWEESLDREENDRSMDEFIVGAQRLMTSRKYSDMQKDAISEDMDDMGIRLPEGTFKEAVVEFFRKKYQRIQRGELNCDFLVPFSDLNQNRPDLFTGKTMRILRKLANSGELSSSGKRVSDEAMSNILNALDLKKEFERNSAYARFRFGDCQGSLYEFLGRIDIFLTEVEKMRESHFDLEGFYQRVLANRHPENYDFEPVPDAKTVEFLLERYTERQAVKAAEYALQSGDYASLLRHHVEGTLEKHLDEENTTTLATLVDLGINVEKFRKGIGETSFAITETDAMKVGTGIRRSKREYKQTLQNMVNGQIHASKNLFMKLRDAIYEHNGRPIHDDPKKNIATLMKEIGDDERKLRKAAGITFEYSHKKDRIKDKEGIEISRFHLRKIMDRLKMKKEGQEADNDDEAETYRIKLAEKEIVKDLTIGYDGGACIGNLDDGTMAQYFIDHASQFIEIYRKNERCGFALVFAAQTSNGEPVLAINSLELSETLGNMPEEKLDMISKASLRYCIDYAKAAGFKHVTLGDHEYNTSMNYGHRMAERIEQGPAYGLVKIGRKVYNEIFEDEDGTDFDYETPNIVIYSSRKRK